MSHDPRSTSPLFTQVDITAGAHVERPRESQGWGDEHAQLLRNMLAAQDRQNELLEEMLTQMAAAQKQRKTELTQWKQSNPHLARSCRMAAESLSKVQIEFLNALTDEVNENAEALLDGEFVLNEFVDRFGPRLAHLNGVLQVLAQLSATPNPAST